MANIRENPSNRASIHEYAARYVKRLSWGAIFAATFIILAVQITLMLLGMAIGLSTVNPATEGVPYGGLTIGAAIWWIVSAIIALFVGGWFAGRLSGIPSRFSGALHGLISWSFASIITMYLLTTTVGAVLGGTLGIVRSAIAGTGQVVASLAPSALGVATGAVDESTWNGLRSDALGVLKNRARPGIQANEAANNEIIAALNRILRNPEGRVSATDRQALVDALVARTDMSREEANATVNQWVLNYQTAVARARGTTAEAIQRAEQAAEATAGALSMAALWAFFMMVLGAASAAVGGMLGAPFDEGTRAYYERPVGAGRVTMEEEAPVR